MVETLIYAYLGICACMIMFNLVCIFLFRKDRRELDRRETGMEKSIRPFVENSYIPGEPLPEQHINQLYRKCRSLRNIVSLDETLESLQKEYPEKTNAYIRDIHPLFVYLAFRAQDKEEIQKAHYAYLVDKYDILHGFELSSITEVLLGFVKSGNLYCRENVLKAFYRSGNEDAVLRALFLIDRSGEFHHAKLLTDGLLSFCGDREHLIRRLLDLRKQFSPAMQLSILNFVRFASGNWCPQFYEILTDPEENAELRFAAIRYFGSYPFPPAYATLCSFLQNIDSRRWEYASVTATAMASYPGDETIRLLKNCLNCSNWYIRYNAAISLEHFNLSYRELTDIYDGNDRYAREMLQYRMDELAMLRQREEAAAQ